MKKVFGFLALLSVLFLAICLNVHGIKAAGLSFTRTEVLAQQEICSGVQWTKYKATSVNDEGASGSQVVNIAEIDKNSARIITWAIPSGNGIRPSTLLEVAKDFETKNPNYKVIAGINNDYFGSNGGVFSMRNVSVIDGVVYRERSSSSGMYGLALDEQNNYQLTPKGGLITVSSSYYLDVYDPTNTYVLATFEVKGFNEEIGDCETVVYKGKAVNDADERLYKLNVTCNSKIESAMYIEGTVSNIDVASITSEEIAVKTNNPELARLLDYQLKVRVYKTTAGDWEMYKTILGCPAQFLKDGEVQTVEQIGDYGTEHVTARHPRTSIGFKEDGTIVFMTIDGRQPLDGMDGVSERENAMAMKEIGVVNAFNFDGGGSTTFAVLIDGVLTVTNSPSDGGLRSDATYALAVVPKTSITISVDQHDNGNGTTTITGHTTIEGISDSEYSSAILYVDGYSTNLDATNFELTVINDRTYQFAVALTSNKVTKVMYHMEVEVEGINSTPGLGEAHFEFVPGTTSGFRVNVTFDDEFTAVTKATLSDGEKTYKCIKSFNGFFVNITSNEAKEYNFTFSYRYYEEGEVKNNTIENITYKFGEDPTGGDPTGGNPSETDPKPSNSGGMNCSFGAKLVLFVFVAMSASFVIIKRKH